MPKASKAKRQKPADHVPEYMVKDAADPQDSSDVLCQGDQLNEYLDELQNDKELDFDLQ